MIRRAAAVFVLVVVGYAALVALGCIGYGFTGQWTSPSNVSLGGGPGQGYWDWAGIFTFATWSAGILLAAAVLVAGAFWAVGTLDRPLPETRAQRARREVERIAAMENTQTFRRTTLTTEPRDVTASLAKEAR